MKEYKPQGVTVIIPSFKRAHLLEQTIPTYFQEGVEEVIIIDDCSPDDTTETLERIKNSYPKLRYFRQPTNMRQPTAKNVGIGKCHTEWIYFGDDDSLLAPGSIATLYKTAMEYNCDIVGARAIYMSVGEDQLSLENAIEMHNKVANNIRELVDVSTLTASFDKKFPYPVEVPFCQAALLVRCELARRIMFDPAYVGNAYREETDFIIRCAANGARIYYNSDAIQVNLPRNISTGGARGKSILKYKQDCIRNNWRFLKKNWTFLQKEYGIETPAWLMQLRFASGYVTRPLKRLLTNGILHSDREKPLSSI